MIERKSCNNCAVVLPAKRRCPGMQDHTEVCSRYTPDKGLMHKPFKRVLGSRMVHGRI